MDVDCAEALKQGEGGQAGSAPPAAAKEWGGGRWIGWAGLLFVLVLVAYLPALRGGFLWDDDVYITSNPLLSAPGGLKGIWFSAHRNSEYCPLVLTVFRFEHGWWDLNPLGYHLVNVCLHGVNALLVWGLLRRLAIPGGWLAAAIFALHPVHVESVAWITELKNTQSTLFYLLALLAWIKFAEAGTGRRWGFYVLALLLHALALFSKTTACTLPAALVLVLWMRGEPIGLRRLAQIGPFLVLGLALGLVAVWWEAQFGNYLLDVGQSLSGLERLLVATRALWFYAGKLVWPTRLAFSYPLWDINGREPLQYIWVVGCVAVAWWLWRRRHTWGRGPIAAAVFFVAALSPLLGFIPVYTFRYSYVADHYQYAASIGLIALFAAVLSGWAQRRRLNPWALGALSGSLLLVLGALTWQQAGVYRDLETLWRDTLAKNPGSWMAHDNLGVELERKGAIDEAIEHYTAAVRLKPDDSQTCYNFGSALVRKGRLDEAAESYRKALQITPDYVDALNSLGMVLAMKGQIGEAILCFRRVLELNPDYAPAHGNLGNALQQQNQWDEAIAHYTEALRLTPDDALVHANLASALEEQGRLAEAARHYQACLRINASYPDVHFRLGRILVALGHRDEARAHLVEALRLKPDYAEARDQLRALDARTTP